MTRILGINGIMSHGKRSTDELLADLARHGAQTIDANYPLREIWEVRRRSHQHNDARRLMQRYYTEDDVVVAHSYGCLVSLRMMEMGARFSRMFWFRPAMNRDYHIPAKACERLYVIHDPGDRAILFGSVIPFHDFGNAGRFGLMAGASGCGRIHGDSRIINTRTPDYSEHEFWHHSDDFLDANRPRWVKFITNRLPL